MLLSTCDSTNNNTTNLVNALAPQSLYSIKKRYFVPRWWLLGILIKHVKNNGIIKSQLGTFLKEDCLLAPVEIPLKYLHIICAIWTDIVAQAVNSTTNNVSIKVVLDKYLRGTSTEISETIRFIEWCWCQSFEVLQIREPHGKKQKNILTNALGSLNFISRCFIEKSSSVQLILEFSKELKDFCIGKFKADNNNYNPVNGYPLDYVPAKNSNVKSEKFVSLNPDVLKAFANGRSSSKLMTYLFYECSRQEAALKMGNNGWYGGIIESKSLGSIHKEIINSTTALYDHGVFGWEVLPPDVKIANLKLENLKKNSGSIVQCWKMSEPSVNAGNLELQIELRLNAPSLTLLEDNSKTLSPIAAIVPKPVQVPSKEIEKKSSNSVFKNPTYSNKTSDAKIRIPLKKSARNMNSSNTNSSTESPDIEFLCKVAEFYETLSPIQKKMFDEERNRMGQEAFRTFARKLIDHKK